jgi:VanZ family protein
MKTIEVPATPGLRLLCFVAALAMTAQLLYLSEPDFASAVVQVMWDKTVHFLFFGTLAFFLWIAAAKRWPLAIWITVLVIGAADETRQAYIPGRNSDVNDWLADGFGAAAALIIAQRVVKNARLGTDPKGA